MTRRIALLLLLFAAAPGWSSSAAAGDLLPAPVVAALEAIVSVRVREVAKRPVWRDGHFETREIAGTGAGTGVVIARDGLILTCAHVIDGAVEVRVQFHSGREESAQVVALDQASDLALLRAPGGDRVVTFAPGGVPPRGTPVFLAGNRDDTGPGISAARIGAHRRVRAGARPIEFWAEVDGSIGPGDSGGAVLNLSGEVLGIPGLQVFQSGGTGNGPDGEAGAAVSSGLFIPASHAQRVVDRMTRGTAGAAWPWIGLLLDDPLLAQSTGRILPADAGILVHRVFPGSPAEAAGLLRGDRIVSVGARPVRDVFEAQDAVLDLLPGVTTTLALERGGRTLEVTVTVAARPEDPRPEPLDDFALHTGMRLLPDSGGRDGRGTVAFASMSGAARASLPEPEAELFSARPALASLLPGADLLRGTTRRTPVRSAGDLAALIGRCFVDNQFVALAHWDLGGGRTLDRAHVHRKIYPVVL